MRLTKKLAACAAAGSFVLLSAGAASAGTGPAPEPSARSATQGTQATPQGNPNSTKAKAAGVCDDARQIGSTGHIVRGGQNVGSVKQFYSNKCNENYGYLWVWKSFQDKHDSYDITAGVYDYKQDAVVGKRAEKNTGAQEFWTTGTDTAKHCTLAVGTIRAPGDPAPAQGASTKVC